MREVNAALTIAYRDVTKFLRDRTRMIFTFVFPFLFIGVLGSSLQSNLGPQIGYNFLTFVFTGVIGQALFQSTASGIISLIEDRTNDFSQEIFVSPISRYTIIIGKILGESIVSLSQVIGIVIFGYLVGAEISLPQLISLIPVGIVACLLGGAFGIIVLANLSSERSANQVFPFLMFPQFFLAGVFNPIKKLPLLLDILSRISPMRYAVDFIRGVYYWGRPEYDKVVLLSPISNLLIITAMFVAFLFLGTFLFVRNERNR
ncbi:MAG TPA: ABC transporter permease [Patescibacteria group bacterium]